MRWRYTEGDDLRPIFNRTEEPKEIIARGGVQ